MAYHSFIDLKVYWEYRSYKGKVLMAKYSDLTSMGGRDIQFPVTDWTKIQYSVSYEDVLNELCQKYWKPLYNYLRCKGFGNDKAKDIVQDFFTEKVLGHEFLQKADKSKGKFRTFLLVAIRNYAINLQKKDRMSVISGLEPDEYAGTVDPEVEFNRVWAEELLQEVLKELEIECQRKGKTVHWQIFREWLLEPNLSSNKMLMSDICKKYGIEDSSVAYNMIANIKKRFRVLLKKHLRLQVESDADVGVEIANFINLFSQNAAR